MVEIELYSVGRGWDRPSFSTILMFFACDFFFLFCDIASKHFRLQMLYYKVLESVIEQEQKDWETWIYL